MLNLKKIKERGLSLRMLWDLFFVFLALVNVALIIFDWFYLYLRPQLWQIPDTRAIVELYDPVKGIHPDPKSRQYLELANKVLQDNIHIDDKSKYTKEMDQLARKITERQILIESGQGGHIETSLIELENYVPGTNKAEQQGHSWNAAENFHVLLDRFWQTNNKVAQKEIYLNHIEPIFKASFVRERDIAGKFVDHFIYLDAPFLLLFLLEFIIRWLLALRRQELLRWWLFPLYNWYDVLGLIPVAEMRLFRLFRIISIYMRLNRSELTSVGDDFISRAIKEYSGIITEEISDRVAVRILAEMQDEIESGASIDIFLKAIEPRRDEIKILASRYLRKIVEQQPGIADTRKLLSESLEDAARRVPSLKMVPDFIKERLTREIGVAVFDAMQNTLTESLQGAQGDELVGEIVEFMIDDLMTEGRDSPVDILYREISLDVIENMKKAVSVKKWALK